MPAGSPKSILAAKVNVRPVSVNDVIVIVVVNNTVRLISVTLVAVNLFAANFVILLVARDERHVSSSQWRQQYSTEIALLVGERGRQRRHLLVQPR